MESSCSSQQQQSYLVRRKSCSFEIIDQLKEICSNIQKRKIFCIFQIIPDTRSRMASIFIIWSRRWKCERNYKSFHCPQWIISTVKSSISSCVQYWNNSYAIHIISASFNLFIYFYWIDIFLSLGNNSYVVSNCNSFTTYSKINKMV